MKKKASKRRHYKNNHKGVFLWIFSIGVVFTVVYFVLLTINHSLHNVLGTSIISVSASIHDTNGKIPPNFLGSGSDFIAGTEWLGQLGDAVVNMHLQTIRYPGGEQSNYWNWQKGDWDRQVNGFTPLPKVWNNPHVVDTLDSFKTIITKTHATPVFVLNMLTAGANKTKICGKMDTWNSDWQAALNDQINFLKTSQAKGLPVKFVELGNELYVKDQSHSCVFANGKDYGRIANYWVTALHNNFPGVKVALDANYGYSADSRSTNWNTDLFNTATGYDGLTIHVYPGSGLLKKGTTTCDQQKTEYNSLQTTKGAAEFFSVPFHIDSSIDMLINSFPSGKDVWITETNVWDDPVNAVYGTWGNGLFMGESILQYLDNPRIKVIDIFDLKGSAEFSEIFANTDAFYKRCDTQPATIQYANTAVGWVMRKLATRMDGMYGWGKFTFSPNPAITYGSGSYNSLVGYMFSNGPTHTAVILNLSPDNISLTLPTNALLIANSFEQFSADPAMLVRGDLDPFYNNHNSIKHDFGTIDSTRRVYLHPYSVTYFIMSKKK